MVLNIREINVIEKIIDSNLIDFLKILLEKKEMSDDNLQRFIKRSIIRKSTSTHGEKRFSKECLCYLLSFFNRFQMFLFYQKQTKNPLCKDCLQHIYSFYGNIKIKLPKLEYPNRCYEFGNLYFYDIKLTRKILEKVVMQNDLDDIKLTYYTSYGFINLINLIDVVLSNIEKGIDLEENEKILEIFKKNKIDIPKHTENFQKWIQTIKIVRK